MARVVCADLHDCFLWLKLRSVVHIDALMTRGKALVVLAVVIVQYIAIDAEVEEGHAWSLVSRFRCRSFWG